MLIDKGSLIRISGSAGTVLGTVEHLATIDDLPDLPGGPAASVVKEILREGGFDQVAMISHFHDGNRVCFVAFRNRHGWWDLKGRRLLITEQARTGKSQDASS